jgi:tetratricopeptide (TPR) repeat protein
MPASAIQIRSAEIIDALHPKKFRESRVGRYNAPLQSRLRPHPEASMQVIHARRILFILLTFLLAARSDILAAPPLSAPSPGQAAYIEGLDALENKKWSDAAKAFAKAIDADEENADYYLARGVAYMLADDLKSANADLDRSYRLNKSNITTQRWYAAQLRMTDQAQVAQHVRSPSDYRGTIQEAAEQYHQGIRWEHKPQTEIQALRDRFDGFAVQFAKDAKAAHPDLANAVLDRAKASFAAGNYDQTLKDLVPLMQANPLDYFLLHMHAVCVRNKGNLSSAREEFTRVLSEWNAYAPAYSERAICEAMLGNLVRAKADFALAKQYDPADAKLMQAQVDKELGSYKVDPATQSPQAQWTALRDAALSGQPIEQLVPLAIPMEKSMNAHRLRWDEGYQEKYRQLQDAVRANPKDVKSLLAVGEFRYRESTQMGEQIGPGGPYRTFRDSANNQSTREISDADAYFDDALKIDANNVMAMTWKAAVQLEHGNWNDGAAWIDKALAIRSDVPELLELLTRVLDSSASAKEYQAQDLRSTKTWTTYGIYYDTIWTHYPTQGELAAADDAERKANALWARAEQSLRTAVAARAGTPDGFYYGGLLENRAGNIAAAVKNFEFAVKGDYSRRNVDALVHAYAKAGWQTDAVVAKFNFTQTRQTTDTGHIAAAWTHIANTAYKKARLSLESAAAIDPADTRIPAYYAAIATINNKPEEALHYYNMALAMEEAHATLKGRSLLGGNATVFGEDVCLCLLLNLRAALRCGDLNRPDEQLACLQRNLSIEPRLAPVAFTQTDPFAVLPNQNDPKANIPRTVNNLMAWSHVLAGYALLSQHKTDEAQRQFDLVWNARRTGELFEVQQLACGGAMRLKWAREDPDRSARSNWLTRAALHEGLSRQEVDRVSKILTAHQDPNRDPRQFMTIQTETLALNKYRWEPSIAGGYDPKQNPNYIGTDDRGPDDAPRPDRPLPANDRNNRNTGGGEDLKR